MGNQYVVNRPGVVTDDTVNPSKRLLCPALFGLTLKRISSANW